MVQRVEAAFTVTSQQGRGVTSQLKGPGCKKGRKKESMKEKKKKDRKEVCAQTVGFQITRLPRPQKAAAALHYQNKFGAGRSRAPDAVMTERHAWAKVLCLCVVLYRLLGS